MPECETGAGNTAIGKDFSCYINYAMQIIILSGKNSLLIYRYSSIKPEIWNCKGRPIVLQIHILPVLGKLSQSKHPDTMIESIKQKQVASLIHHALADLFIRNGAKYYGSAFVTLTHVRVTPDLMLARIYLSVYNKPAKHEVIDAIAENAHAIRHDLGAVIRHKLRRIPELEFYLDDTLDEAEKIDRLFDKLKDDDING
ncbi:30S ribosome-binding factor RbfA [Sphingobacteriales bacterium UPWRP_1]|nr:ribosome-binding factor A [Sphingobacteriales bacterium TSM_CSS]PSJ78273.1 30S ribosome-binding factor RbfA [Sphingobacteriales bacterium UPWRP_1]